MKHLYIAYLTTLIALICSAPLSAKDGPEMSRNGGLLANDPDQIIAKYIDAMGGSEKTRKIKNSIVVMKADFQGTPIVIKSIADAENGRMMQETTVMGNVATKTIYKDGKAIMLMMGQQQELPEDVSEALRAQTYVFPESRYREFGYTLKWEGVEEVRGEEAHKILIVTKSGTQTFEYYSVATGLKLLTKSDAAGEIFYSEYKEFKGIKFPTSIAIKNPMLPVELVANLVSVELDTTLSDSDFQ